MNKLKPGNKNTIFKGEIYMKVRLPKAGGFGNIKDMAAKVQDAQNKMEERTKELEEKIYTFTAGGKAVKAEVKGTFEVTNLQIDPEFLTEDSEMLTETIIAAVNGALKLAKDDRDKVMDEVSSGLNLPNIPGLF